MRALREQDYDEMAGRVVDRFLTDGVKMGDAAVEEAIQGGLNPDQIERLVQAANTMAFLRMMESRKADGQRDMTHEFEPIETRSLIQSIIGAGPSLAAEDPMNSSATSPVEDDESLPDEMGERRRTRDAKSSPGANDGPFPKGEKQKTKERESDKKPAAKTQDKDLKKEAMVINHRRTKLASVLDDQLYAAEMAFDDGYERLARLFKLAHGAPVFEAFEKDAMSVECDQHALVIINLMRQDRGMPLHDSDSLEKFAQLNDRHVADDTLPLREFCALVKIARHATRVRDAAAHVRSLCS